MYDLFCFFNYPHVKIVDKNRNVPNSIIAVAARGQSGARATMALNMTAAEKLCVQKNQNLAMMIGSRA